MDDDETALNLFRTVLEGGTKMDIHRLRAECMVGIGEIMLRRGDSTQAREMWAAAHPFFLRSSRMKDAASVEKRLAKLSQQIHSHPLRAIQDSGPNKSTPPVQAILDSSENDTAATESYSVEKLQVRSTTSPSLIETGVDCGTST
jgi:hypothetical protein